MRSRILLLILVPPILLFLCALLFLWVPLPHPFPLALSTERNQMAAFEVGIMGMGYLIGLSM